MAIITTKQLVCEPLCQSIRHHHTRRLGVIHFITGLINFWSYSAKFLQCFGLWFAVQFLCICNHISYAIDLKFVGELIMDFPRPDGPYQDWLTFGNTLLNPSPEWEWERVGVRVSRKTLNPITHSLTQSINQSINQSTTIPTVSQIHPVSVIHQGLELFLLTPVPIFTMRGTSPATTIPLIRYDGRETSYLCNENSYAGKMAFLLLRRHQSTGS